MCLAEIGGSADVPSWERQDAEPVCLGVFGSGAAHIGPPAASPKEGDDAHLVEDTRHFVLRAQVWRWLAEALCVGVLVEQALAAFDESGLA